MISSKHRELEAKLKDISASFADASQEKLLSLCGEFTTVVAQYASGEASHADLFQMLKVEFGKLKDNLKSTKPNFVVSKNVDEVLEKWPISTTGEDNYLPGTKYY